MNRTCQPLVILATLLVGSFPHVALTAAEKPSGGGGPLPIELGIGGAGGVYFLAEPGELIVEVEKRDRNRAGRRTELRAILVGPDRQVLQDVTISDDGLPPGSGLGPPRRVRLATKVVRKGVYGLNITISQDRYGEEIFWGFATNCRRYLIETSRGHRDARHEEPIVLFKPKRAGDVCFLPRRQPFAIEVTGLPKGTEALTVHDGHGTLVHTLRVEDGKATHRVPADPRREALPWRLHLPDQQATIHIDGVTRWEPEDAYPNLSLWTPDPSSWFSLPQHRWLLTPYSRLVYGQPGEAGEAVFQVHNNADWEKTIQLQLEFPGTPWPAKLSAERVVLGAKKTQEVRLRYTVPTGGETQVCHLRATPTDDPAFTTYATLTVRAGVAPASRPIAMPLMLKPYAHENEQFGYRPDYSTEAQVYFDLQNRPLIRSGDGIQAWRGGRWTTTELPDAIKSWVPSARDGAFTLTSPKVVFDRAGDAYLLGAVGRQPLLLHSTDGGQSFTAYAIPGKGKRSRTVDMEQFSGHNVLDGPPPLLVYTHTASDPKRIFRRINDLELILPRKVNGRLSFGEPVLLTRQCIGFSGHSGSPSGMVSRGQKVHVVWAEATDPDIKIRGVPTYVATYDRQTQTQGKPVLLGHGAPPNDVHNSPSITMDSKGFLHVLVGTHSKPFPYTQSLKPNDAYAGWTEPVLAGAGLSQTYIGLVCGPDDTLHLVYRLWRRGEKPFPASLHAALAYQRKRPGQPWEAPRMLVVSPFSEYSVFYHRLTIDRTGRLFVSYDYWSTYWFYRTDHLGSRRALLMSADAGETWKLAETADLRERSKGGEE